MLGRGERRSIAFFVACVSCVGPACGDDGTLPGTDGGRDSGGLDGGTTTDAGRDAGPAIPWPRELPSARDLGGSRRTYELARAIIHLHSPISHDACDGEGWVDGALGDPACLAHFRDALCATRTDVAMVTDHAPHMNEMSLEEALLPEAGDEIIRDAAGDGFAKRITCADGHRVTLTVGSENSLMPVGLRQHVLPEGATIEELEAQYDGQDAASVAAFRAAGALVLVNHTEGRTTDDVRTIAPDGIEIYNVHANLDPRIRVDDLGLTDATYVTELLELVERGPLVAADLAFLAFFAENRPGLTTWDTLLSEGVHMPGLAGSDAHENAFPALLGDGERADSFRRILRWFSNHLLVDPSAPLPDAYEDALAAGRFYVAFEAVGSPVGFDFVADDGGVMREMGDTASVGATLHVTPPALPAGHPSAPAPSIRMRLLRAAAGGGVEIASTDGTDPTAILEHVTTEPGAYRVEVFIDPRHAAPYLADRVALVREHVWVYSNAIYVEP